MHKDEEYINLFAVTETARVGKKLPKEEVLRIFSLVYEWIDRDQLASIFSVAEKIVEANLKGYSKDQKLIRDFNPDGTRKMDIKDELSVIDEDILLADGLDEACVGYVERCGEPPIACYDKEKCLDILARDMTDEEALDYFYHNVLGSHVGDHTPCFINLKKSP